ncbi:CIA30 family protein [Mycobacterium sp. MBM]|nr:CIA30 family protein [Mycobacterium sp. MBM]
MAADTAVHAARAAYGLRLRRALACIVFACSALVVVSCARVTDPGAGTAEPTAQPSTPEATQAGPEVTLIDLGEADKVAGWTTVNDPVMGGQSTSRTGFGDGGLVFSGNVSLQNNGGFASARSPQDPGLGRTAAAATALRVHAVGDGKTYLLKVAVEGQPWSYIQRFRTDAAVERTYELPIDGFQAVGQRLDPAPEAPPTLDPSRIDQVSVYILDKQQGPFQITVREIGATL